ncbi:FG-GAP-like repeat-containing protein [Microbacterium sp. 179-I 3D2 NHS]|uniref:FG-GAP-like repeat-containing protein n=1 Tax=Microbacterium sp. 179-I 3D2 NHS TaxID=3235178 RepID=UPI0039A18AFD
MRQSPRRLLPRSLRVLVAAIALTLGAAALAPATASAAGGPAGDVFALTNAQRAQAGLPALVSDSALDAAAAEWARQLASSCTLAHSTSAWRSSRVAAYGWVATGENIAAGQPDAASVVSGWMNSPGHRANILDKRYTGLGVGYATGTCYRTYWVQIFGIGSPVKRFPGGVGDLTGDKNPDVLARTSTGELRIYPGTGKGSFLPSFAAMTSWGNRPFSTLGDFTGDGIPDITRTETDGRLMLHAGNGKGGFLAPVQIGTGWSGFSQLIGGVDFTGDQLPDVIGRTPGGDLLLYAGNGRGGWLTGGGSRIGNGWHTMDFVSHVGDFNGDGRSDLIARRLDASLWIYPTTGRGAFGTPSQIGHGWGAMTSIHGAGDFDGNGTQDIIARTKDGTLLLYGGNGRGGFLASRTIGSGWNGMSQIG